MKIFVSSVMNGFQEFREAAFAAIRSLDHDVVRAEDFPASTTSSRVACLQGVREADLVVLILGERYGWSETHSGLSPTHEEFREAVNEGKVISFVQTGVTCEPAQQAFVEEVENYDTGMHRGRNFVTPEDLRTEVTRALARHQLSAATAPVDVTMMVDVARRLIPDEERGLVRMTGPLLHLAIAGGPTQTIIRPSEIEDNALMDGIIADLSAPSGYFSYRRRTEPRLENGALLIEQENGAMFRIDEAGAMLLSVPIEQASGHIQPLIEENVSVAIEKAFSFADRMLEKFDRTQKLTRIVIAADIRMSGVFGWRTAREQAASPDSIQVGMNSSASGPVMLNPPDRTRMALRVEHTRLTEDLLALLRRRYRS
ncbi:DUF4062 domain-containing protein [Novosphingobium sp. SL115]|uniref:DUF4062 domain-containing protein n=1 Tax=Novosphingobium sp. SL115 TaxID=2995150 RepID=UPI002275CA16|nr:DUF4062 domain-containing protein [Novosphingobium sp. SL115]MCY1669595.1 DUF4062 domain-containing protein [Novosphingobium sp. SL115]